MSDNTTAAIESLVSIYGKETDAGFGSAVFQSEGNGTESLEDVSFQHYIKFLGGKITPESEARWREHWKACYRRPANGAGAILTELNQITGTDAKQSIQLLTEFIEPKDKGIQALEAAFNLKDVQELIVHTVGDGEAYSGAMVSALYNSGKVCSVVAMMD